MSWKAKRLAIEYIQLIQQGRNEMILNPVEDAEKRAHQLCETFTIEYHGDIRDSSHDFMLLHVMSVHAIQKFCEIPLNNKMERAKFLRPYTLVYQGAVFHEMLEHIYKEDKFVQPFLERHKKLGFTMPLRLWRLEIVYDTDFNPDCVIRVCQFMMNKDSLNPALFTNPQHLKKFLTRYVPEMDKCIKNGYTTYEEMSNHYQQLSDIVKDSETARKEFLRIIQQLEAKFPNEVKKANARYAHGVASSIRECAYCTKRNVALSQCSKCKAVWYCNKNCQKKHWALHRKKCLNKFNK